MAVLLFKFGLINFITTIIVGLVWEFQIFRRRGWNILFYLALIAFILREVCFQKMVESLISTIEILLTI